ncbi:MAG: polymer-forming cytoskeletal protein [Phycisphaerales bacterium]|nr:polymer-forming cytoskeletal protein [Phycisphaerales bacterium]
MFQQKSEQRIAECYHCGHRIAMSMAARSVTCPRCYRGLVLDDLIVRDSVSGAKLITCGRVVVERKGRAVTRHINARDGVEIEGEVEAQVSSGGVVHVGSRGCVRGDIAAASLVADTGAVIDGFCRIGNPQA